MFFVGNRYLQYVVCWPVVEMVVGGSRGGGITQTYVVDAQGSKKKQITVKQLMVKKTHGKTPHGTTAHSRNKNHGDTTHTVKQFTIKKLTTAFLRWRGTLTFLRASAPSTLRVTSARPISTFSRPPRPRCPVPAPPSAPPPPGGATFDCSVG